MSKKALVNALISRQFISNTCGNAYAINANPKELIKSTTDSWRKINKRYIDINNISSEGNIKLIDLK